MPGEEFPETREGIAGHIEGWILDVTEKWMEELRISEDHPTHRGIADRSSEDRSAVESEIVVLITTPSENHHIKQVSTSIRKVLRKKNQTKPSRKQGRTDGPLTQVFYELGALGEPLLEIAFLESELDILDCSRPTLTRAAAATKNIKLQK